MNSIEIQHWHFIEDELVQQKTFYTRSLHTIANYIHRLNYKDGGNVLIYIDIYRFDKLYKSLYWPLAMYANFDKYIIFEYLECHHYGPEYNLEYDINNEKTFEDEPFYKAHVDDKIIIRVEFIDSESSTFIEKLKSICCC